MSLKLYANIRSPPCRSVIYVLRKLSIEHEYIQTDIPKDTRNEEWKKENNPRGLIPVLEVDGVKICESNAIVRYLLDTYDTEEVLFPRTDRVARAKVDEIMDFSGSAIRPALVPPIVKLFVGPVLFGMDKPTEEEAKASLEEVHKTVQSLDDLLAGKQFFAGDHMTIGDIVLETQLATLVGFINYDFTKYENLKPWRKAIHEDQTFAEIDQEFLDSLKQ